MGSKTTLRITYPEGAMQRPEQYERDSLFVLAGFKWQDFKWLKYIVYKERVVSSLRPGSSPSCSGPAQLPRQPLPLTRAKNNRNLSREAVRTRCSQGAEGPGDAKVMAQTPGADVPAICCLPSETQALVLPQPSLSQTPGAWLAPALLLISTTPCLNFVLVPPPAPSSASPTLILVMWGSPRSQPGDPVAVAQGLQTPHLEGASSQTLNPGLSPRCAFTTD